MLKEMSLGDFVKQVAASMHRQGVAMPFKNQRPWHFLLYELKKAPNAPGRPAFLDGVVFDWDGPYPKSQELSDFLHALHWNASVSANNPHYDTIILPGDVADLWSRRFEELDGDTKQFLDEAARIAQVEFSRAFDDRKPADALHPVG